MTRYSRADLAPAPQYADVLPASWQGTLLDLLSIDAPARVRLELAGSVRLSADSPLLISPEETAALCATAAYLYARLRSHGAPDAQAAIDEAVPAFEAGAASLADAPNEYAFRRTASTTRPDLVHTRVAQALSYRRGFTSGDSTVALRQVVRAVVALPGGGDAAAEDVLAVLRDALLAWEESAAAPATPTMGADPLVEFLRAHRVALDVYISTGETVHQVWTRQHGAGYAEQARRTMGDAFSDAENWVPLRWPCDEDPGERYLLDLAAWLRRLGIVRAKARTSTGEATWEQEAVDFYTRSL